MLAQKSSVAVSRPATQGAAVKAAGAVAAVLLTASPALAGVVFENQPSLKKVFQAEPSAPAAKVAAAPRPKQAALEAPGGDLDPKAVALPAALVVVGSGAFALSSVDAGFNEFMRTAAVKDSGEDGAGYETDIKGEGGLGKKRAAPKKKALFSR